MNDRVVKVSPVGADYRSSVQEGAYDIRKLTIGNQTGTAYINA
jgi:hypothetical protein